ncbi:hypothetical protein OESDEN_11462 [Oesophagostomum dentatum]|uniref:Catalase immune-responsive domain-containing protein n=1 Tax=Oesophagostomum dentatum TaxID=61180 RepID=A0A0B1SXW9_OESDE|nr:hypothetical protein OESDEN_11462 [Oesophagostomum dentatum]
MELPGIAENKFSVSGDVNRYEFDEDYYEQPRIFYKKVLNKEERARLEQNIFDSIKDCYDHIQDRALKNFGQVDPEFGNRLRKMIDNYKAQKASLKL